MNEKKAPGVMIYFDCISAVELLASEEKGELFSAILHYAFNAEKPNFKHGSRLEVVWEILRPRIDSDKKSYQRRCEQNRLNALKRTKANDND